MINRVEFSQLLKAYKTTNMSGYEFIEKLEKLGISQEMAYLIHEAATSTY